MLLKDILRDDVKLTEDQKSIEIKDITIDEDKVKPGDLFFDLKGDKNLNKIFEKGASFVVRKGRLRGQERVLDCEDARKTFALASKHFYSDVCDKLKIIGITGTNGKSSTVKLVADILNNSGLKTGTVGTLGCRYSDMLVETGFTTPDPNMLHSLFFKMYKSGVKCVVMEVSAHAIALNKLDGINFELMAITNITQDHLDFFGDMDNYANTKFSIFNPSQTRQGLICVDDKKIRDFEGWQIPTISYGLYNPSDIFAIDIKSDFEGSEFICNCLDEVFIIKSNLIGDYNVENTLCAIGTTYLLGIEKQKIVEGVQKSMPEAGRFNVITFNGINVVIDYAHTPDGLKNVLEALKPLCKGKLYTLFGCGGNRDKTKRPIMGMIAETYSDQVFLTSDNPRLERPESIIDDIKVGMSKRNLSVNSDRKESIRDALEICKEGDTLLIAGKGAENYQDINGQKIAYSDFDEVSKFFREGLKLVKKSGTYYES